MRRPVWSLCLMLLCAMLTGSALAQPPSGPNSSSSPTSSSSPNSGSIPRSSPTASPKPRPAPLTLTVDDDTEAEIGQSVTFNLVLTNVSKSVVTLTYVKPPLWYPEVISRGSKKVKVPIQGEVYDGPCVPVHVRIEPGKRAVLYSSSIMLLEKTFQGPRAQMAIQPGTYDVTFHLRFDAMNKGDFAGTLHSKPALLKVLPRSSPTPRPKSSPNPPPAP